MGFLGSFTVPNTNYGKGWKDEESICSLYDTWRLLKLGLEGLLGAELFSDENFGEERTQDKWYQVPIQVPLALFPYQLFVIFTLC
jgi:hypothetical protein